MRDFNQDEPLAGSSQDTPKNTLQNGPLDAGTSNSSGHENILASLSDWVWEVDSNGFITYSNPAVKKLIGFDPQDLIDTSLFNLVHKSDLADARTLYTKKWDQIDEPEYVRHNFISRHSKKILLETSGSIFYDSQHNTYKIRFVSRAVVKSRLDENSRTRMAVYASNNINEAIAVMNPEMIITYINKPFTELFGYTEEEIIGQSLSILGSDESLENINPADVSDAMETKKSWYGEVIRRSKNNQFIPCMLSARSVYDRNNNFTGFIGTYMDLRIANQSGRQIKNHLKAIINGVCNAIEDRSVIKSKHQENVTDLAVSIALDMGKNLLFIEGLSIACQLHDLGEMYIPPEIANQVGRLDDSDLDMIRTHPKKGYEIISRMKLPWPVAEIVLQHHERIDGSGYPYQLKDEEIMLEAKILAVADVVETMLTDRPYRKACSIKQCLEDLLMNKGLLYDADVVDTCIKLIGEQGYRIKHS